MGWLLIFPSFASSFLLMCPLGSVRLDRVLSSSPRASPLPTQAIFENSAEVDPGVCAGLAAKGVLERLVRRTEADKMDDNKL